MQRAAVRRAVADVTPIVVGYLPLALLMGTSAVASGVDPLVGWMVSPVVFAGAAQLVLYRLVEAGAPALVVLASVLAVNARLQVYGMAVAPAFAEFPRRWRLAGPFLLTDPMFALASVYFEAVEDPRCRRWYYATAG
jgi:predicted branched-subunit amino acid permease